MPGLAELQARMAAAILAPGPTAPDGILDDGVAVADRIAIYRGNTLGNLTDALADAFPVTCQLVGDDFFAAAAATFIRAAPPMQACLADYGEGLAAFLAAFPPAATLPYLPDVARLDWAVHRAFHAADAAPLAPARLATAPALDDSVRLVPHPACHLVVSHFPVDRIWRAHHGDSDLGDIDLAAGAGCQVLVDRNDGAIRLLELGDGERALLAAVLGGARLGAALAAAAAAEPTLDLPGTLARHLHRGTFCDLESVATPR